MWNEPMILCFLEHEKQALRVCMCVCGCVYACVQLCRTLCGPIDYTLPSSSVHEIFQAKILEWVAISYSRVSSGPRV